MKVERKGLIVALVHVLLVCSLGAKLLIDRKVRPRVWVKTTAYDPEHIIRGRYVSLSLEVPTEEDEFKPTADELKDFAEERVRYGIRNANDHIYRRAKLIVRDGKLQAVEDPRGEHITLSISDTSKVIWPEPVHYYIPEHAEDPSRQPRGSALWAEVTVPKKGPPRPIQLATSGPQGWHVLNLR